MGNERDDNPPQEMGEQSRPPQFDIDQKWDKVIDLSLRRVVYGSLAAGITSLVLFRGASTRAAITGIGAGFGAGSAWADSQREIQDILHTPIQKSKE